MCGRGGQLMVMLGTLVGYLAVAQAADSAEEALIREGIEHRRRREDAAALPLFQPAYELHHSPRSPAQAGLDEIALGRWIAAHRHLDDGLAPAPDPCTANNRTLPRK